MGSEEWAVGSPGTGVAATRSGAVAAFRRGLGFLVVVALAMPIVGHGCHRWDHDDDEPAVVPVESRSAKPLAAE